VPPWVRYGRLGLVKYLDSISPLDGVIEDIQVRLIVTHVSFGVLTTHLPQLLSQLTTVRARDRLH
jgi:hypothetical protein